MNIVCKIISIYLLFLISPSTYAQYAETNTELKIGDKVPDTVLSKILRYPKTNIKISDFKDKLLILDFWDTYCSSCIELMPKMDSLQNQFGNQIKILPVTYQKKSVVTKFFNSNTYVKNVKLSCIVEDKVLQTYFPHQTISHLVWIYKGVVKAITYSEYLNAGNIQKILDGKAMDWPVKTDRAIFDYNQPFGSGKIGEPLLRTYLPGVERKTNSVSDSVAKTTRFYYVNFSILDQFRNAWSRIQPNKFIPHPGRLVLEVKDPSKYVFDEKKDYADQWSAKNVFCYERIFKKLSLEKEDYRQVIRDLDSLFKVNIRYEEREADCLIIYPLAGNFVNQENTVQGVKKQKIDLVAFWLDYTYKYPPVIDESQYTLPIPIGDWKDDLQILKKELNKNGFDIKNGRRKILQMIVTERK